MNFSEYILVSFGDSFTFGQDTVENSNPDDWKKDCNINSYTQVLADKMGFKDNLNFGVMGGSNERSLTLLENFLRNNPEKKIFVLFNFTSSSRFLQYLKIEGEPRYASENIHPATWNANPSFKEGKYTGITKRVFDNQYTYWRNSIQDVYHHVKDRRNLYYLLSSYNTPHVSFDIMNDTDKRMLRDNPMDCIDINEGFGIDLMYNDENYVFKEMDFLNSYHQELVDKSPLLTHIRIDDLDSCRNIHCYLRKKGQYNYDNENFYESGVTAHWNSDGHIEVSKLIEKFINDKDYD
jgi:hypothetical protein